MKTEHPITPPPELVREWAIASPLQRSDEYWAYELYIAHHAARWGADQELEACCADLRMVLGPDQADWLRSVRRPKPPSLKEQALDRCNDYIDPDGIIRRALEALPDV